jgi:hypothetical protein
MFYSLFFHSDFHSCHCHDALSDAMALAAAFKVEMDLQEKWREEMEPGRRSSGQKSRVEVLGDGRGVASWYIAETRRWISNWVAIQ